jgi:membrane protein
LNKIWGVPNTPQHRIWGKLKNRFLSFLMVLAFVFLLPLFLAISAIIPSMNTVPGAQVAWWAQIINLVISFVVMMSLFAMIFRIVPDKEITWTDVWLGAAVTSVLFMIGRYVISLYLLFTRSGSTYGAAGSLIVLLVWVYYSAQIFLLGAEFTQAFAKKFGSRKNLAETPVLPSEPS